MSAASIDPVLLPLTAPLRRQADTLLDLRTCALSGTRPGRCIVCYFALQNAAAEAVLASLCPLRRWLETHIEVVASDALRPLETLPLQLDGADDLETYCRRTMAEFQENRAYDSEEIRLEFRFRAAA